MVDLGNAQLWSDKRLGERSYEPSKLPVLGRKPRQGCYSKHPSGDEERIFHAILPTLGGMNPEIKSSREERVRARGNEPRGFALWSFADPDEGRPNESQEDRRERNREHIPELREADGPDNASGEEHADDAQQDGELAPVRGDGAGARQAIAPVPVEQLAHLDADVRDHPG